MKRPVKLLDLAVLLYHVHRGANDFPQSVGFEDAERTLGGLTGQLNASVYVDIRLLESALWSCSLLNDQGHFWHPKNIPFENFVKNLSGKHKFNYKYNVFE